jgi:BlaI family penicillinase repressor
MKLSETEWRVMNEVWRRGRATARDVHDDVAAETGWAYTTVKTILARLAEKGVLSVEKRGNASRYEPTITRDEARRSAVHGLLDRAFEGAFGPLFNHLLREEKLSKKDRAELRRMLDEDAAGGEAR